MRQLQIQAAEEGQRLDKYLSRYMPEAPKSFFYKMLRKKNITCNKKKCDGSEKLCAGDCIELFLAEDTIEKFRGNTDEKKASSIQTQTQNVSLSPKSIIYEDDDILLINKAAGELSQKASPKDVSMVELEVKPEWEGKNLSELNLRRKYSINVVAIIQDKNICVNIDPEKPLKKTMRLIVIANTARLGKLK